MEPKPPSGDGAIVYNLAYLSVPGVRFAPTYQELILHYLQRKLRGKPPLYADAVNDDDIDVYSEHPKDLVRKLRKGFVGSWYLFSPRCRKYRNGDRPRRGTDDDLGYWKSTEARKDVIIGADDNKEVIGHKCVLTYHEFLKELGEDAKPAAARKQKPTEWKMTEFISVNTDRPPDKSSATPMLLNDYVLCKITNKNSLEVEEKDPSLAQSMEEEEQQGAPSDGTGASHDQQQQSTTSEGPAGQQDEQQHATPEAPVEEDTVAAAATLQQAGSGDFALGAKANIWLDDDIDSQNWWAGYYQDSTGSYNSGLGGYIQTADNAGDSQPAEQQQATPGNKAATAAADTDSLSPDSVLQGEE